MKKANDHLARRWLLVILLGACLMVPEVLNAQTTEFPFSGDLGDPGINGSYDMQFRLYETATGDTELGGMVLITSVTVSGGKFKVNLDFNADRFPGADRWIEIRTSPAGSGTYTTVTPREKVLSSPYAIRARVATNSDRLGGTTASEYVQTTDLRLFNERAPTPGSSNYIHNSTSAQSNSNFNISGNGTAGGRFSAETVNATSHFTIFGARVLTATANWTLSLGFGSGFNNLGDGNSFIGTDAGRTNTTGEQNSFVGILSGFSNTTGSNNSFLGRATGFSNTTGSDNVFLGYDAGRSNTTGNFNTAVGSQAKVGTGDLSHATAIGAGAVVNTSNTLVLGRPTDRVEIGGLLRVSLGAPGKGHVCRNSNFELSTCSSSIKYKSNIVPFRSGLDLINGLRPVSFTWKDNGALDLGLVAEEVNSVEPLLSSYNDKGEVEGVKYDRIGVVLINAIKEQQAQIEEQRKVIEGLRKLVCKENGQAQVCK